MAGSPENTKRPLGKGKTSEPKHHFQVQAVNLRGCMLRGSSFRINVEKGVLHIGLQRGGGDEECPDVP